MSEVEIGKKYRVINNRNTKTFGVNVGDVGEVTTFDFDFENTGVWLFNEKWEDDGIWYHQFKNIEEITSNEEA